MSRDSIELSKKYGVNPTIPVCFFCGEEKNEIVLLGRIREKDPETGKAVRGSDLEAPHKMVLDYEPCDKCKEKMNTGVTIISVRQTPISGGQPPIAPNAYPTGAYVVIKPEALNGEHKAGEKLLMLEEEFIGAFSNLT